LVDDPGEADPENALFKHFTDEWRVSASLRHMKSSFFDPSNSSRLLIWIKKDAESAAMNVAGSIGHEAFAKHPFVARLSRLMKLSAADLRGLELIIEGERLVKKREDLVVVGDAYRNLCFVKDGYAIRYQLLRSGKRQILNVILPGDVIGFPVSFFDRSIYSVVAISNLTYNICPLDAYARLCYEQPRFGLALSWLAAYEAAIYAEHIVDLGRRTPLERLAHFLLEIHARLLTVGRAEKTCFDLPFSQEIMADVLGLSVPHLNRVMQQLRGEQLITTRSRLVELTDMAGLQKVAQYQPLALAPIPVFPTGRATWTSSSTARPRW
jgi:CRP-like cAMP-binding protein